MTTVLRQDTPKPDTSASKAYNDAVTHAKDAGISDEEIEKTLQQCLETGRDPALVLEIAAVLG